MVSRNDHRDVYDYLLFPSTDYITCFVGGYEYSLASNYVDPYVLGCLSSSIVTGPIGLRMQTQ